jgi:hypothetical protein
MSENKSRMKLFDINRVEGFDPTELTVEYSDLTEGVAKYRLPVHIQIGWFRLKYPDGRISVNVKPEGNGFAASAKIYQHCKDDAEHYLSAAEATRYPLMEKPEISAREWAQTAAIGIALRNAGFGLQFDAAGEAFESSGDSNETALTEEMPSANTVSVSTPAADAEPEKAQEIAAELSPKEMTLDEAYAVDCPISKYKGKNLREVLSIDQSAILWIAQKYNQDERIQTAAQMICTAARAAS